ncbi:MAG: hypothetical protein QM779_02035 [Propionicimonas sp.]|uniref:hypothetical protein n=1 Tax=Propionicimonas sp. TaxID=1955623 RepID=UPI003D119114
MFRTRGRPAMAVLAAAAALLLTGCDTSGSIEVVSADELKVDLVFTDLDATGCTPVDNSTVHVTATPVSADGTVSCHVQGSVQLSALEDAMRFTTIGDYTVLTSDFSGIDTADSNLDLEVIVPGEVVAATRGVVSHNSVHYTGSLATLAQDPLTIVSTTRQQPPPALFAGGGALLGVALTLFVLALRRRATATSGGEADAPSEPVVEPVEGQPSDAADGLGADPDEQAGEPSPPPDHSIWAPPEDEGIGRDGTDHA